jgi:hypothetical protein
MYSYINEAKGEVKEAFQYAIAINDGSIVALSTYAITNYGDDAKVREMTENERTAYLLHGPNFFQSKSVE